MSDVIASLLRRARGLTWLQIVAAGLTVLLLMRLFGPRWSDGFPSDFPDSASYLEVADRGPFNGRFWFGERPILLPLLAWLLARNVLLIVVVQSLLSVAATWWSVIVVRSVVRNPIARWAAIVMLLGVAVQPRFALWNTLLLSESLSMTAGTAMIATWVWCAADTTPRRVAAAVATTGVWALARDSNVAIVVVFVVPVMFLAARQLRERTPAVTRRLQISIGVLLLVALFAFIGQTASQRNRYPTLNVIGQRVLVSDELTDLYRSFGMPDDAAVMERTGHSSFDDGYKMLRAPELSNLREWAKSRGQLVHLWSLVRESPTLAADVWRDSPSILRENFGAYDQFGVALRLPSRLPLGLEGPRDRSSLVLWGVLAALLLGAMALAPAVRRQCPVLVVAYITLVADGYLSWLGDSVEVHRHMIGVLARSGVVMAFIIGIGGDAVMELLRRLAVQPADAETAATDSGDGV